MARLQLNTAHVQAGHYIRTSLGMCNEWSSYDTVKGMM